MVSETPISRRTLAKGAAWAVPVIAAASVTPTVAASAEITCPPKAADAVNWLEYQKRSKVPLIWHQGGPANVPFWGKYDPKGETFVANSPLTVNWKALKVDTGQAEVVLPPKITAMGISWDPETGFITGQVDPEVESLQATIMINLTAEGLSCSLSMPVTIVPTPPVVSVTQNLGETRAGDANIYGFHITNTTSTPIKGRDFKAKIHANFIPKQEGAGPLGSTRVPTGGIDSPLADVGPGALNLSSYMSWSPGTSARPLGSGQKKILVEDGGGIFDNLTPNGKYKHLWTARRPSKYDNKQGIASWHITLADDAVLRPGETLHVTIGQPGPNTFVWIPSVELDCPGLKVGGNSQTMPVMDYGPVANHVIKPRLWTGVGACPLNRRVHPTMTGWTPFPYKTRFHPDWDRSEGWVKANPKALPYRAGDQGMFGPSVNMKDDLYTCGDTCTDKTYVRDGRCNSVY